MDKLIAKFAELRQSKNARMIFLGVLLLILIVLYFTWGKAKGVLIGLMVLVAIAMGIEATNYDIDLGKLFETGNVQESRVQHTKDGVKLYGSCIKGGEDKTDLNCANFKSQAEAQAKYEECAVQIEKNNSQVKNAKSLDIYGLDGDKDGKVCEALPKN